MSDYGLWVYYADGTEKFNPLRQTIKFMGTLTVNGSNSPGSITDPRFTAFTGHKGFWAIIEASLGTAFPPNAPVFQLSGDVLSWSYPAGAVMASQTIIYGILGTR